MKNRKYFRVLTAAILAASLAACGSSGGGSAPAATTAAASGGSGQAASGGEQQAAPAAAAKKSNLIVAITGNPTTIDPHGKNDANSMALRRQVYEGLTLITEDMEIEPCLAESWEYKDDTHMIFHIRKGVKFSDGNEVKAEDVAYSIQRAYDGNFATAFMAAFDLENSKAIDDYTYELALKRPSGTVLQVLAYPDCGITEKSVVEGLSDQDIMTKCPGTGAYVFKEW